MKTVTKKEIFNFNNEESLRQFTEFTSNTDKFSRCYDPNKPMKDNANKFFKTLDDGLHRCFSKIRIESMSIKQMPCEIQNELDLIGKFKQDLEESKCKLGKLIISSQLEKAEARVTNLMADRNANLVTQQITQLNSRMEISTKQVYGN